MKVTILGCGSSGGVPLVGCRCPVCTSSDPRNKRMRVSILVEEAGQQILVDTSPDLREQCLRFGITEVDAILYTHDHADHCHGIDDVRPFNHASGKGIPAYMNKATLDGLTKRFPYAFLAPIPQFGWFRPCLLPIEIKPYQAFHVGPVKILPFEQVHGKVISMGFRFGKFAYSTDVNFLSDKALELLQGIEVWVVDCLRTKEAPTHAHIDLVLEWVRKVAPSQAILTHMNHEMEYESLITMLPDNIKPAYDGLILII